MKSFAVFAALAGAASAYFANGTTAIAYTTITVDSYTTYCPEATSIIQNNITYTATASQTLTITDCPCTKTVPVFTPATSVAYPTGSSPAKSSNIITTTTVVSSYVTVCPSATTFTQGSSTYTVTAPTTLVCRPASDYGATANLPRLSPTALAH